jgi:hypothetical protein
MERAEKDGLIVPLIAEVTPASEVDPEKEVFYKL